MDRSQETLAFRKAVAVQWVLDGLALRLASLISAAGTALGARCHHTAANLSCGSPHLLEG